MNYPAASGRGIPLRKIPPHIAASGGEYNPKKNSIPGKPILYSR